MYNTLLGYDEDGLPLSLSGEERRLHTHIFGAPGQGKSKLIELLVRANIADGYGCCVLDPGDNGDTVARILRYCCMQGFEKVCLINPPDFRRFNRVPVFNPFKYNQPTEVSVGNILDALGILFSSRDFTDLVGFRKFASALLSILHRTRYTLAEVKYFLEPRYVHQREHILHTIPNSDFNKATLSRAKGVSHDAVANRFGVFNDYLLRLMLGSKHTGINFKQMIRDGWVILVNLDPAVTWGTQQIQQRLLGTLIINEIVNAVHELRERDWDSAYYLYIDEVGDYATSKLAFILDKKRKTGLSFTVAHQRMHQLSDLNVRSAIRGSAAIKVLFHTPEEDDRRLMEKDMGFRGEADLRALKVQQAAIAVGKAEVRVTDLVDVDNVYVPPAVMRNYKIHLYNNHFYRTQEEINNEIDARITTTKSSLRKRDFGGSRATRIKTQDPDGAEARAADDNQPSGKVVLPHREKRTALQGLFDTPKKD